MTEPLDPCTCDADGIDAACVLHGHLVRGHLRLVRDLVDDYDRRRSKPWGRFLLWLLRKTT
jgi:hypothetical protein